jgi:hypothetical protein
MRAFSETSQATPLQPDASFILPRTEQDVQGPVHSIVSDTSGNHYATDELNHSVISFDPSGRVRWKKSGRGSAPGEFCYPCGLSVGWIQNSGRRVRCLGIADSWNHRVQFLDFDGTPIASWTRAGEFSFVQISDLRFVPDPEANIPDHGGVWYVVDRGTHNLFMLGADGKLHSKIGQEFPSTMQARWAMPVMRLARAAKYSNGIEGLIPLDFLFYPERILGRHAASLFIWEPSADRLKYLKPPHLLPVEIGRPSRSFWVAADSGGFLSWDHAANQLTRFSASGKRLESIGINGIPVPSDLPIHRLWLQNGNRLERWTWDFLPAGNLLPHSSDLLACTAGSYLDKIDQEKVRKAIHFVSMVIDEALYLSEEILWLGEAKVQHQRLKDALTHLRVLAEGRAKPMRDLHEALHPLCVALLIHCLSGVSDPEPLNKIADRLTGWAFLNFPLFDRHRQLKVHREYLANMRSQLPRATASDPEYEDTWRQMALEMETDLERTADLLWDWSAPWDQL